MVKYNALVSYPINSDGHKRAHQVVVYFEDKNTTDEDIIELADEKINNHSKRLFFSIVGPGTITKRDYITKVQ